MKNISNFFISCFGAFFMSSLLTFASASTNILFVDNFPGPVLNPLWVTNLPNVPVAKGDYTYETYLGAPNYQFQTLSGVPILRMNTEMSNLQRVGWSLNTNFNYSNFRYDVRFNTLTQSAATSIDAFVEIWILNATNYYDYDIVSLFGSDSSSDPRFDAGSSISGVSTDQSFQYQNNTYYHLTLGIGTNSTMHASLYDDSGNQLVDYDLNHPAADYANGFTIGLSQAIDRPNTTSPTDVAIASALIITNIPIPPRSAMGMVTTSYGFITHISITDGGYGYTNTPQIKLIGGGGSGAQFTVTVSNGIVINVNIINAGSGYTNTPLVVFTPPLIPSPVLNAGMATGLNFINLSIGSSYQLQHISGWYWTNVSSSFIASNSTFQQIVAGSVGSNNYRLARAPVPAQAFAVAQTVNGFVVQAIVTSAGSGYSNSPAVNIVGGGGTNATAIATVTNGIVKGITITSAGIGYTNLPTIQIAPPPVPAFTPTLAPAVLLNSQNLITYQNYQIEFVPTLLSSWSNWNGGLFMATNTITPQFILITNNQAFFRLQYTP